MGIDKTSIGSIGVNSPISPREGRKPVKKQKKELGQWQTGTTGGTFGGQTDSLYNSSKAARRDSKEKGKGSVKQYQSFNQISKGAPKTARGTASTKGNSSQNKMGSTLNLAAAL